MVNKETAGDVLPDGRLAATIAHEIRNPLALIKANLQYVELCDANGMHKKNYDVIYKEIDRINDILRCYIDTATPGRLMQKRFALNELVCEIEQIFKQTLSRSNISLHISVIDGNMNVKADYNKLKQVLINVVQNAKDGIEAAQRENGLIEVAVVKADDFANICITDNGVGLSEDDIKRVGTPFFTKKDNGCGLGISISKEIMRLHRGALTIRGAEGAGVSVTISIPLYN